MRCLICLDEDVEAGARLHTNICACKSSAIHTICLEQMVNSDRMRMKDVDSRMRCSVCLRRYTLAPTYVVLPAPPKDKLQGCKWTKRLAFLSLARAVALLVFISIAVPILVSYSGMAQYVFACFILLCLWVLGSCLRSHMAVRPLEGAPPSVHELAQLEGATRTHALDVAQAAPRQRLAIFFRGDDRASTPRAQSGASTLRGPSVQELAPTEQQASEDGIGGPPSRRTRLSVLVSREEDDDRSPVPTSRIAPPAHSPSEIAVGIIPGETVPNTTRWTPSERESGDDSSSVDVPATTRRPGSPSSVCSSVVSSYAA
jgi:hypothetical protein